MKKGLPFLIALASLVLIGAVSVQLRAIRHIREIHQEASSAVRDTVTSDPLVIERLRSPHAVLVLDVSGSMTESDPLHLQAEAVRRFYEIYRDLSAEVLMPGDTSYLAVVLFSTIAQTIDWSGKGDPWLPVSIENTDLLSRITTRYLGDSDDPEDPRQGQDTDHLAALHAVDELVKPLRSSPPVIVFMTDGIYQLHPLFSPILDAATRRVFRAGLSDTAHDLSEEFERGDLRLLPVDLLPGVLNRRDYGIPGIPLPAEVEPTVPPKIAEAKQALLNRRFYLSDLNPRVGPLWAPVFLSQASADVQVESDIRSVLSGAEDPGIWTGQRPFIRCSSPEELVGEFVGVVSRWFRLFEQEITPGNSALQIPAETQAFAVHLETQRPASRLDLLSESGREVLNGRGRIWSGVAKGTGLFSFDTDGGEIRRGTVFLRPRHEWVLRTPAWFEVSGGSDTLEVGLVLVSLEKNAAVHVTDVFDDTPGSLPAMIQIGPASLQTSMTRTEPNGTHGRSQPSYVLHEPIQQVRTGEIRITVDLTPLRKHDITTTAESLSQTISARARARLIIRDAKGRKTAIHVEGIPREASSVRRAWSRIKGRLSR